MTITTSLPKQTEYGNITSSELREILEIVAHDFNLKLLRLDIDRDSDRGPNVVIDVHYVLETKKPVSVLKGIGPAEQRFIEAQEQYLENRREYD